MTIRILLLVIGTISIIVMIIRGIWWAINHEREKRKEQLKNVIKNINHFTRYKELYKFLFKYHSHDLEKLKKEKNIYSVDYFYFIKIFRNKIKFSENKTLYQFPLIYNNNWLKSNNKNFDLELIDLDYSCKNYLLTRADKFLKRFDISDFNEFLKKECEKNVWLRMTFDLYKIEQNNNGKIMIFCCKGNYFDFVKTYELIQKELYYNFIYNKSKFILRETKNKKGKRIIDNPKDYSWRPSKIGINVFTVMKRADGGYSTFIHKRKIAQVEYPGFYHVVPAGTFQPVSEHVLGKQYSFGYTIFREFLEELFDLEKVDREFTMADPLRIFSLSVEDLEQKLPPISPGELLLDEYQNFNKFKTEKYEIIPTGFLIDITSFKPEFTFILFIKEASVYETLQRYIRGCYEADISEYDLSGNKYAGNIFEFLSNHLNVNEFLPAGAVAISEGLKWYKEMQQL